MRNEPCCCRPCFARGDRSLLYLLLPRGRRSVPSVLSPMCCFARGWPSVAAPHPDLGHSFSAVSRSVLAALADADLSSLSLSELCTSAIDAILEIVKDEEVCTCKCERAAWYPGWRVRCLTRLLLLLLLLLL